ncbi:MAG: hypothetical protein ACON3Z_12945 [Bradymonadia bacterium]
MNDRHISLLCLLFLAACMADPRTDPVPNEQIWSDAPSDRAVAEPINFQERGPQDGYGLPTATAVSIESLINLLPQQDVSFDEPRTFTSADGAIPCNTGDVSVLPPSQLPATIEGVITLHPRRYLKIPVCDQDEKHYGSFTIEDDTGGIVVLRDSRIAPFRPGDRVRMTVHALTMTYLQPSTRAILSASVERLPDSSNDGTGVVYYDRLTVPFSDADFTKVKRIEGWAIQAPSNKNFGALIVADRDIQVVPGQATNRVCESNCFIQCKCGQDVCRELVCPAVCAGEEKQFDSAELPVCWQVGFDVELTRRGFGVEAGDQLTVTGPVVDNYDIQIWVQDIGQIEILSEN